MGEISIATLRALLDRVSARVVALQVALEKIQSKDSVDVLEDLQTRLIDVYDNLEEVEEIAKKAVSDSQR